MARPPNFHLHEVTRSLGIIRVLTSPDDRVLQEHARILGPRYGLQSLTRCIPDQPNAIFDADGEAMAVPKIVQLISDLQIEYSLISRGPEADIFPTLKAPGVGVAAYGVLSRGLLPGSKPTGPTDFRTHLPGFTGDNAVKNQQPGALKLKLSAADLQCIEAVLPASAVAGTRYDAYQMGHLDSEK